MNFLYPFIFSIFLLVLLKDILFWLYLWQLKEYRWDRIFVHLQETNQGRAAIWNLSNAGNVAFFVLYLFTLIFLPFIPKWLPFVVFLFYVTAALFSIRQALKRKLKRPRPTLRVLFFGGAIIFLYFFASFFVTFDLDMFFWYLMLDISIPFVVSLAVLATNIPSRMYQRMIIRQAAAQIQGRSDILVIGITGCVGKGSTKEAVATILSGKFKVAKTIGTYNTPIGVAQSIIKELKPDTEIFIVEMGGYKRGEIAEICDIVRPKIGIITAVEDQHLSLYGSEKNLMDTTYELVEALPEDGLCVFNGNSARTKRLYERTRKQKILCYAIYKGKQPAAADIVAEHIIGEPFSISFDVKLAGNHLGTFTAGMVGTYNAENILPGIFLGRRLDMSLKELTDGAGKIIPVHQTMEPRKLKSGVVIIDDTHNASLSSVMAAVEYMKQYKGKKVMVLHPMIELGENAKKDHREAGKKIGAVCDYLFLTNDNFQEDIAKSIAESKRACEVVLALPEFVASFVKSECQNGDIVVFEGREAQGALLRLGTSISKDIEQDNPSYTES